MPGGFLVCDEENYLSFMWKAHSCHLSTCLFVKNDEYRKEKVIVSKYTVSFTFIYASEHIRGVKKCE